MNMNLGKLSFGEKVWLWRMRQPSKLPHSAGRRSGTMTHVEAATLLGISTKNFARIEDDAECKISSTQWMTIADRVPFNIVLPDVFEQCMLARKRSGLGVIAIADELGLTGSRFFDIERRADVRIIALWQHKGFIFHSVEPKILLDKIAKRS